MDASILYRNEGVIRKIIKPAEENGFCKLLAGAEDEKIEEG
jgi:hypothetical protein